MRTTIGEIINEIIPFCSKIEVKIFQDIPFVSASLKNDYNLTVGKLYVAQTAENLYSICSTDSNIINQQYFPTGSIFHSLMAESDIVPSLLKDLSEDIIENVSMEGFMKYLYYILYKYEITRFNPKHLTKKFSGLGFRSKNIIRNIDKTFELREYEDGTIKDLLKIMKDEGYFILGPLKAKETHIIELKLKDMGLIASIKNNRICNIKLDPFHKCPEQKLDTEYI